jgi:outer membrane protein assembly factor BamB
MRVRRVALSLAAAALMVAVPGGAESVAKTTYAYDVPTQATSPWPSMRRDRRNTGATPVTGRYGKGDKPWRFKTGKGIFSTPVIGGDGAVYVGSADGSFYALEGRTGKARWSFKTGGIIDAAAVIGAYDRKLKTTPITIGSGDEVLYKLRTDRARISRRKRTIWRFFPTIKPATGQIVNWWEGNVALGFDGTIYAGNTGGGTYAINQDGRERWAYTAGNSVWTTPAFARDGTTFWGSLDLSIFALDRKGKKKWSTTTIGFNTSSPALSPDEKTLYAGSFDSKLYALDAQTGVPRWTFQTRDHIYSSPALGKDTIYVASTDGSIYAVDESGRQRWRYDTGDPVRSSPVLGADPSGGGQILYVGSSDGKLYALDAETGKRRWSYDTTPGDAVLKDRNDLNGSPALGTRGVYIGGEHGYVTFVPYDWCLQPAKDPRCDTSPGQPFGDAVTRVFGVSPGGATLTGGYASPVNPSAVLNARLVLRRNGQTSDAGMLAVPNAASLVKADPPFPFTAETSPDGHHLFVAPSGFLEPGTTYTLRVAGNYGANGIPVGNTSVGGTEAGPFGDTIRFTTAKQSSAKPRLAIGGSKVTALSLSRLAIPLPPFLTSVNQIGFDSYDWIAGTVALGSGGRADVNGEGSALLWVIGAKRNAAGVPVPDRGAGFAFPLTGRYRGDTLLLSQKNLRLTFSFGDVPMRRFDVRMQLDDQLRATGGASVYAEVTCSDVPTYGPVLPVIGLCNPTNTLAVSGTLLSQRFDRRGTANRKPASFAVTGVSRTGDEVSATFTGTYPAKDHIVSILLVDPATGEPLAIDQPRATKTETDAAGNIVRVRVTLPPGAPPRLKAYVMADVFPLAARDLSE